MRYAEGVTETRWLSAEEQSAWRSFLDTTRLLFDRLERELQRDGGMPLAYYEILVQLSEAPQRTLRMSDLAASSRSSRSRLSHATARLEEAGWVRREECPTDGRGAFAALTEKGFAALERAAPRHVASVRAHLFDHLSDGQVTQLRDICQGLLRHLAPRLEASKETHHARR